MPPESDTSFWAAYYTVDKKEVPDRQWPLVADILKQLGFASASGEIDASEPSSRQLLIPWSLCLAFEKEVVGPWQAAWRSSGRAASGAGRATRRAARAAARAAPHGGPRVELAAVDRRGGEPAAVGRHHLRLGLPRLEHVQPEIDLQDGRPAGLHRAGARPPRASAAPQGQARRAARRRARHNLLLTDDGEAFSWGRGTAGQLGAVASGCTSHPVQLRSLVLGKLRISRIACGAEHSCLLTEGGDLLSFGSGKRGQTGLGTAENTMVPQRMAIPKRFDGQKVAAVSCGALHTAALLKDGTLLTCGASDQGVLGQGGGDSGEKAADRSELGAVHTLTAAKTPVAAVSCGGMHNLVMTRSAGLFAFGAGSWGRLGLGSHESRDKHAPTKVKAADHLGPLKQIAAGHEHSLLLTAAGAVFQFGRVGSSYISTPSAVSGLGPSSGVPVTSLSAGKGYTVAIAKGGEVRVWGSMAAHGAIGLGEVNGLKVKNARQPTRIDALLGRHVVQAAAGGAHIVILADTLASDAEEMALPGEVRFGATSHKNYDDALCETCNNEVGPENGLLLFCDFCNKGYHLECHEPRLDTAPEGDWLCYNCKLEKYSVCQACGMDDDIQTTLVLCENRECAYFGACHVECMPVDTRPPVVVESSDEELEPRGEEEGEDGAKEEPEEGEEGEKKPAADEAGGGDKGADGEGGGGGGATAPADGEGAADADKAAKPAGARRGRKPASERVVTWKPGDPKRWWTIDDFHWFCDGCKRDGMDKAMEEEAEAVKMDTSDGAGAPSSDGAAPATGRRRRAAAASRRRRRRRRGRAWLDTPRAQQPHAPPAEALL